MVATIQAIALSILSVPALAAKPASAIDLQGRIAVVPDGGCTNGKTELYLSEKGTKTLLFQVDVIPNGTFEFHLKEGTYLLKAISMNGCEAETTVTALSKEPVKKVTLTLAKRKGDQK